MVERDKCVKFIFFSSYFRMASQIFSLAFGQSEQCDKFNLQRLCGNVGQEYSCSISIPSWHQYFYIFPHLWKRYHSYITSQSTCIAQKLNLTKAKSIYRGYNRKSSSQKKFPFVFPLIILLQTLVCML